MINDTTSTSASVKWRGVNDGFVDGIVKITVFLLNPIGFVVNDDDRLGSRSQQGDVGYARLDDAQLRAEAIRAHRFLMIGVMVLLLHVLSTVLITLWCMCSSSRVVAGHDFEEDDQDEHGGARVIILRRLEE